MAPPLIPPAPERTVHQHRPPIKGTYSVIPIHIQHLNTPSFTSPAPPPQATAARRRRTPPLSLLYHSNSYPTLEHSPRSPAISSLPIINTMAKRKTSSRVAAKKKVVVEKPLATKVTLCVAATPATRRAAANSPKTP